MNTPTEHQPRDAGQREDGAVRFCKWWQQDDGHDVFSTSCGHEYQVNDCTDGNVQLPFCPYCARRVQGIAWAAGETEQSIRDAWQRLPEPNWCTTCQRHRSDPKSILCSNPIHLGQITEPDTRALSESSGGGDGVLRHPHTGEFRDYRDVESDPEGKLCVGPGPLPADTESGLTPKQAWWAGYRAGKGLPPHTPRSEAITAPAQAPGSEALRALVDRWRKGGAVLIEAQRVAYESAADELESLIATAGEPAKA